MSYILDALKRADTERERGAVPGLYARQVINPTRTAGGERSVRLWASFGVTLLVLGLVAAGLYFLRPAAEAVRPSSAPLATSQAAPSLILAPPPQPAPKVAVAATPLAPPAVSTSRPTVAAAASNQAPAASAQPIPTIPLLSELPEEVRRQIPALAITGVVFSDAPGQRLLLVNNQVMTQGSPVTPELTLTEVGPKSSVFSFRGTRFRLQH